MAKQQHMCPTCNAGPFAGEQGVSMHRARAHTAAGKRWGKGKKKTKKTGITATPSWTPSARNILHNVMQEKRAAMRIAHIVTAMQQRGYRPDEDPSELTGYISQMVAKDDKLVRTERGVYRLKVQPRKKGSPPSQEQAEPVVTRDLLLLRNDTLQRNYDALHDAHLALLRGMNNG